MRIISLFILFPLLGAFAASFFAFGEENKTKIRASNIIAGFVMGGVLVLSLLMIGRHGIYNLGGWSPLLGITLVFDGFASSVLAVTSFVVFMCTVFSFRYIASYNSAGKFYTLLLLMVAGINGVLLTGDIFNLFIFLEIASVSSYALVAFGTSKHELEASFKYLVQSSVGAAFILLGIAFVYSYTSNLNMAHIASVVRQEGFSAEIYLALAFFTAGFSIKAALIPFHAWLPDAHPAAPAPVSAMLSGVLIKTVGIYALVRLGYSMLGMTQGALPQLLIYSGVFSMIFGALLALGQWDFKRLLAFHSISQMGYIALGFGLATPLGITAGLFHLMNHSVFKSLLFLNAGAVYFRTGIRDLRRMKGIAKLMPVSGSTSMIASLSISGIPPFNGFWSKLLIIIACVQAGHPVLAFWAVLGSIITLSSFMKVQKNGFLGETEEKKVKEAPLSMTTPMIALAFLCVFMGLMLLPGPREILFDSAAAVLLESGEYIEMVLGK